MHTIFDSHPEDGVGAIAISQDAKYLVTLGAGKVQVKNMFSLLQPVETEPCKFAPM